jgi:hypothetical protein
LKLCTLRYSHARRETGRQSTPNGSSSTWRARGHTIICWLPPKALELALDIRKFEIDLYWKRATYFWAFITAAFAGYGLVQKLDEPEKTFLSVVFACLGLVFS